MKQIYKPFKVYVKKPTIKQWLMCLPANFLLWWAWRLYRDEPEEYFEQAKKIILLFYGWIKY